MRIKHRFAFNTSKAEIISFLSKQNIELDIGVIVTAFEIFEDDASYSEIKNYLEYNNIRSSLATSYAVFTQDEINEAQWLGVRSAWYNGYPQPQNSDYISSVYDTTNYCDKCDKGLVQKGSFTIKKEPNWGRRNFFMLYWVHDELFASSRTVQILKNSSLTGFGFLDVLTKSKGILQGTKQIIIEKQLEHALNSESIAETFICAKCNAEKYIRRVGTVRYDKRAFMNIQEDIVKSQEKFGQRTCSSMLLITQRFYKVLTENQLDRSLIFQPISLVE